MKHYDSTDDSAVDHIISSSGEKRPHWTSKLQKESDIMLFPNDPKFNPRARSPTSFDGGKPSYVEWSEDLLTYLSITDYQEFTPIFQAVTGHKDVIAKKIFIQGVLTETVDEITNKELKKEALTAGARGELEPDQVETLNNEISALNEKKVSRESRRTRADNFLRHVLLRSTSGHPNIMVRRVTRTSGSDSDVVTGLEIWRQMAVTCAGSAQTWVVTLLKQIKTPTEWNLERSPNVLQMYHHWLELISKRESLSSEKIASSIRITLALDNVRGLLALSINEKSTWSEIQNLLNYFIVTSATAFPQTQRRAIKLTSQGKFPRRIQKMR